MTKNQTNILLITADDMNWDATGAFGSPTPDVTPNIDALAASGMRFNHAHVTIAVCQPSRSVMFTGRYPHCSGGEGFYNLRRPGVPILPDVLKQAGYHVGILGKVEHSTPYPSFAWDMVRGIHELGMGRNPEVYRGYAADFFTQAKASRQPFFLMANSHDPHRPFHGNDPVQWYDPHLTQPPVVQPSRVFTPQEVVTPGFLPDLPEVRREIAEYFSSCRRCDDTVGSLLAALDASGQRQNTIVIFLSDNGMAFPFAKTNCYLNSTRTPWIMSWPEHIQPDAIDDEHFISGIDLMPTLMDALNLKAPSQMDGQSFLPVLLGQKQAGRDKVFTQFHQTAGKRNYPMRCVQDRRFGYIFNPWSDGKREFMNESQSGRTMQAMREAAADDPQIQSRVDLFLYRVPEEFYDFSTDPDGRHNLIDDPAFQPAIQAHRQALEQWMVETGDPALEALRHRQSCDVMASFMHEQDRTLKPSLRPD